MDWQAFNILYRPGSNPSRPQSSHGCAKSSQFGHRVTTSCYKALHMDLMIAAAIFHFSYGLIEMKWQAFNMLYRPGSNPSRPQKSHGCAEISQFGHCATTSCYKALPTDLMIAAGMFHLHLPHGYMALD